MSLTFTEKGHRYRLDGRPVPSVTTLIKGGLPAPALMYWAARTVAEHVADHPEVTDQLRDWGRGPLVAALKEVPWQKRDTAAVQGTSVHDLGERLAHGETVEVPEHLAGYVDGYVQWLDTARPEVLWTERPVASRRWWYAGKFDLIARLHGQTWLLDLKTARGVYGETALQLAAYAGAEFFVDDQGAEQPLPQVDRLGVLHVQDGATTLYPVTDPEQAWKDWLHVAWVGRHAKRISDYIGEPWAPAGQDAS